MKIVILARASSFIETINFKFGTRFVRAILPYLVSWLVSTLFGVIAVLELNRREYSVQFIAS